MGEKVFGFHAIEEAIKLAPAGSTLYLCRGTGEKTQALEQMARATGKVAVKKIAMVEMDRMVPGTDHRGAVLDLGGARKGGSRIQAVGVKEFCKSLEPEQGALVVVLDGITDPHNLGAILRSCDQFGVGLVVIPERRSVQANETVTKVSSGAAQYVPMAVVTNLARELQILKENGFWVYGADMNGDPVMDTKFTPRTVLVMGSEGDGMSRIVREGCDHIVSIPMEGHIDSLNVSVATGIMLYEIKRQMRSIAAK